MPELPEVETIRLHIRPLIIGKTITSITVFEKKQFVDNEEAIFDKEITDIERRGKILIIKLSGKHSLLIHLKMSGQILFFPHQPKDLPKYTRIIIIFSDKSVLIFNDMRKFGWMRVIKNVQCIMYNDDSKFKINSFLGRLGVEPLSKDFATDVLHGLLQNTKRPIKTVLMDQTKIAGIGNIYANEALFQAGILPAKPAKKLSKKEILRLREAIINVLRAGILYGGSSAKDSKYVRPDGSFGNYQEHFLVYQRENKKCPNNCGSRIKRISLGGRGTFYCGKCQR